MNTNLKSTITILIIASLLFLSACTNEENNNNTNNNTNNNNTGNNNTNNDNSYGLNEFNECLAQKGLIIYGSEWCPACKSIVQLLGGYESVKPVYVECTQQQQRCNEEKKTTYVPEIQFLEEVYEGQRSINALAELTNCQEPTFR